MEGRTLPSNGVKETRRHRLKGVVVTLYAVGIGPVAMYIYQVSYKLVQTFKSW
jgi:hypothetical protein